MRISGGEFKGRTLRSAVGPGLRPAMAKARQAVFSMLEARGLDFDGAHVLDLYAGSGSLGIEAVSRGAALVVLVDNYPPAVRSIRENLKALGLGPDRARVVPKDVLAFLRRPTPAPFDLVFIDPPYGKALLGPTLELALAGGYCRPGGLVSAEVEAAYDLDATPLPAALSLLADRRYGQTRMLICRNETEPSPSTPAPSTP